MRSVATALRGQFFHPYEGGFVQDMAARMVALLGKRTIAWSIGQAVRFAGQEGGVADLVSSEQLARWAVGLYENSEGPFDSMVLGAPSGGVADLAVALGSPLLSEHFASVFRARGHVDDISAHLSQGEHLARRVLHHNPQVHVVQHYDPVHDRSLLKCHDVLRFKLLEVPAAYRRFMETRLRPGGTIFLADCTYTWPQYSISDRYTFQVGGLGGLPPDEYAAGSERIETMQRVDGSPHLGGWALKGTPLEARPESEWGTLSQFRAAAEAFAKANGYGFVVMKCSHPEQYAEIAFRANLKLCQDEGVGPQGTLVECFTQANPVAARRSRLLPLWLPWNCTDSLPFLAKMAAEFPPKAPVLFMPAASFSPTFDMASLEDYRGILRNFPLIVLGMNHRLYPVDPTAVFRATRELRRWCERNPAPLRSHLLADDLGALLHRR